MCIGLMGRAWPVVLLVALAGIAFAGLLTSPANQIITTIDIENYFHWVHQFAREELLAGKLPLWNPYSYAGTPFVANPQTALFYPGTWLILMMPVIHAHKWMIAIHCAMAGGFMYLFLRRVGLSQLAALAGCLPWMFSGYFMGQAAMGHLTLLFNMAWLSLALYCYERGLSSRHIGTGTQRFGWFFATGFVLGVQLLGGEPQVCYYSSLLIAIYGLVRTICGAGPREARWSARRYGRWLGGLLLIAAVCVLTSGIQFMPTAEFALHSDRSESSYDFVTFMSFPFKSFIGLLLPWRADLGGLLVGSAKTGLVVNLNWEYAVYVGIVTLVLAGVSLGVRRRPALLAVKILLAAAVLLMLGKHTPIYPLLYKGLPGLQFFRVPARAIVMFTWAISVMGAFGFEHLFAPDGRRWQSGWWRGAALAVLVAAGALLVVLVCFVGVTEELWTGPMRLSKEVARAGLADAAFLGPLIMIVAAIVLVAVMGRLPRRLAAGATLALLAIDLLVARPTFDLRTYSPATDWHLQAFLQFRRVCDVSTQPFRVDMAPSAMNPGAALGARVENVNAYWPTSLKRFYHYVHAMRNMKPDPLRRHELPDALYTADNPFPLRVLNVRWVGKFDYERGVVHGPENLKPAPRAWVVDRAEVISDEDAILARMREAQFDPVTTVILEKTPRIAMAPGGTPIGTCRVHKYENGDLDVDTETSRDGYLVLSEVYYPGWRATVDGQEVPVERADYVITALPLPAGRHHVTYRYDPVSFKIGAACTAFSCVAAVVLLVATRLRKARPSHAFDHKRPIPIPGEGR